MNRIFKFLSTGGAAIVCVTLCFFSLPARASAAQTIKRGIAPGAQMRLAGRQNFSLTKNAQSGGLIRWRVDREETDERGGAFVLFKNVAEATGKTASFDFPKISGKETVYHVSASGKKFTDTQKIQVFEPNAPASFVYRSAGNPDVRTFIVVPEKLNPNTRLLVVMSGLNRNADEYLNSWKDWAAANDYIVLSPTFDEEDWKGSRGYNLGNVFSEDEGAGALNPKSKWSFTITEAIQQTARARFGLKSAGFDIFGHSAGAQFVHRFLLFVPESAARCAIAANAGWYTLPDADLNYSYGLKHPLLSFTKKDLIAWTNRKLVLMRGTADTSREGVLRKTPEADAQGQNRFERAAFMFARVRALNAKTNWRLIDVPNVGHDQQKMAVAAQEFLRRENGF